MSSVSIDGYMHNDAIAHAEMERVFSRISDVLQIEFGFTPDDVHEFFGTAFVR